MRFRINIVISILALMAIVWSLRFAVTQEHRRTPQYLRAMFQELNKQFFQSALPDVRLEWANLTDAIGQTTQEGEDSFLIRVDRSSNFWDDDELTDTVAHETCHIATWGAEENDHGPRWQACMAHISHAQ